MNAQTIAPLVSMGVVWASRKGMAKAYASSTGEAPPKAEDDSASFRRVVLWAVATAVAGAVIEVAINRAALRVSHGYQETPEAVTA